MKGTLIEAAASIKSLRRHDEERQPPDDHHGNPSVGFRGETLRNQTNRSMTAPEARLMRKSKERKVKLVFMRHALMENGNKLLMDFAVSSVTRTADSGAAPVMLGDEWSRSDASRGTTNSLGGK